MSEITGGGDLAVDRRQKQPVAVVQGGVCRKRKRTGKFHAEKRIEVHFCGMAFPIGRIAELKLFQISGEKIGLRPIPMEKNVSLKQLVTDLLML